MEPKEAPPPYQPPMQQQPSVGYQPSPQVSAAAAPYLLQQPASPQPVFIQQPAPQVSTTNTTVVVGGGPNCPAHGRSTNSQYTCCGICCAICLFPCGIICCCLMKRTHCTACGLPA